jgi:hypothetical protein
MYKKNQTHITQKHIYTHTHTFFVSMILLAVNSNQFGQYIFEVFVEGINK